MTEWTEATEEICAFIKEKKPFRMVTDYFPDNRKVWTFYDSEKKDAKIIATFESFFDMNFFKNKT